MKKLLNMYGEEKKSTLVNCKYCESEFKAYRKDSKYCSDTCRAKSSQRNKSINLPEICTKCNRSYSLPEVIRGTHNSYCDSCWKKYQKELRDEKKRMKLERKSIDNFEGKVRYLLNKIELNNKNVSMSDINDLITYYQLTFLKVDCIKKSSMGTELLGMYGALRHEFPKEDYSKKTRIDLRK